MADFFRPVIAVWERCEEYRHEGGCAFCRGTGGPAIHLIHSHVTFTTGKTYPLCERDSLVYERITADDPASGGLPDG